MAKVNLNEIPTAITESNRTSPNALACVGCCGVFYLLEGFFSHYFPLGGEYATGGGANGYIRTYEYALLFPLNNQWIKGITHALLKSNVDSDNSKGLMGTVNNNYRREINKIAN